jgi:hypothetical protein
MPHSFIVPYGEFMSHEFTDGDVVAFGCCRGEAALVAGVTNKGKSTLMRVVSMCAASGRDFSPFVTASSDGLRVILVDYEGSASRTQADLRVMEQNLTENERELLKKNLFVCHAPRVPDGEPLTLSISTHMAHLKTLAARVCPDIIIIDTVSAAFAPKSENDNAEISRMIMKPLIEKLARLLNCVAVIVGHIGKASREEGATREAAHKMRGGSAYGDRATAVFNIEGDSDNNDRIRVICAKEKTGKQFEITLELNRKTRWLSAIDVERTTKPPTSEDLVLSLLIQSSGEMKTKKVVNSLARHISERTAKEALANLRKRGLAHSTRRGYWKAGQWEIIVDAGEPLQKVQSAVVLKALHDCTNNGNGDDN